LFQLHHITLTQFRNYLQEDFRFHTRLVAFCGNNGIGKTNLLDAIYYLCFTKSYFGRSDQLSARTGFQGFRIEGRFSKNERQHPVVCIYRETGKKELMVDNETCSRFSSHIGNFPAVIIAPDDISLITGPGNERRRFLDTLLSQLMPGYIDQLIRYNKVLLERNSLLKKMAEGSIRDFALLDILDGQLAGHGDHIYAKRQAFMFSFFEDVQAFYGGIAGEKEKIVLQYKSHLHSGSHLQLLKSGRERDLASQRTNTGVHRDDIDFYMDDQAFRSIASQGQRKSLLFALKLAEFAALKKAKGYSPILLLDDIFEKLDEGRMMNLLKWVYTENDGQVFITDTHCERIKSIMEQLSAKYQLIELSENILKTPA
jgi:DNA replication and repair protein RecF